VLVGAHLDSWHTANGATDNGDGAVADRDKLAVFLNDDPGSGRTLGFYMEENAAAKTIFDAWLAGLKDLGVTRNVIEGIGSTDHVPFNEIGLPGFTVIKEFDAYDERTRHTNADFPERMSVDELKQSAIVLATFAWHSAMRNERIPRAAKTSPAR
jgi:Zn-dependent M28 family amino/carboxypeptidase